MDWQGGVRMFLILCCAIILVKISNTEIQLADIRANCVVLPPPPQETKP
jgi:hypothetical protein